MVMPSVMRLPQSRLARAGLALLPWLPVSLVIAVVWSASPATDHVLVETMRLDQPSIHYSAWHQAEEQYPGFGIFVACFIAAILAFFAGLVCLAVAFLTRKRVSDATPTI
jgi:hypothetical protein